MIQLIAVRDELIPVVAKRLAPEDVTELERSGWSSPEDAIRDSVETSIESFMAVWDGKVQAVFGIAEWFGDKPTGMPRTGVPWLLSATPSPRVTRQFMRICRDVKERWEETFPVMFNAVDVDHVSAQRWLVSIGLHPYAVQQRGSFPFIEFGVFPCAQQP